jgi:hypothetical protein
MTVELKEVKELAKKIYNSEHGTHYLLGYIWGGLSPEKQQDVLESLQRTLTEQESK